MHNCELVLAGGGARGVYQIGVWKALRELNILPTMAVGTSIGAINGALIAQNDFEIACEVWQSITLEKVLSISSPLKIPENLLNIGNAEGVVRELVRNTGLDTTPLRELLMEYISEKRVRASLTRFGLATFSLTDFKQIEIFIDEIPEGKLIDYILASACVPGFCPVEIDKKRYLDGGLVNNLPISLALQGGAMNILAVDLGLLPIIKHPNPKGANVQVIRHNGTLGGFLDLDHEVLTRGMKLGYIDAMREFGKLMGGEYAFDVASYSTLLRKYTLNGFKSIEYAAILFGIDQYKVYNDKTFMNELKRAVSFSKDKYDKTMESMNIGKIINTIKEGLLNDTSIGWDFPLVYLIEQCINGTLSDAEWNILKTIAPRQLAAAQITAVVINQ